MAYLHPHLPLQDLPHNSSIFQRAQALPQEQVPILCQLLIPHCAPPCPLEQVPRGDEAMLASKHIAHLYPTLLQCPMIHYRVDENNKQCLRSGVGLTE